MPRPGEAPGREGMPVSQDETEVDKELTPSRREMSEVLNFNLKSRWNVK